MPVQCACVNLTIARVRMILKREFGWTTQGSRIRLSTTDLNTGPGTGHVVTISAAGSHRYSHRRLNSLPAQPAKGYKNDADRTACYQPPIRGRQIKFTPERLQQIRNLVERGKSREEIAEFNRRDRWFPASHLFKVRDQCAATSCF